MRRESRVEGVIYYYLKEKQRVEVLILDEGGKKIKALVGSGDKGINVATWDFSTESIEPQERFAPPGKYTISLITEKGRVEGVLELKPPK